MRRVWCALLVLAVAGMGIGFEQKARGADDEKPLAHMVFFGLKDRSVESRQKFVESCQKYLSGHEDTVYFSVGVIAEDEDVQEPVSVKDFDVALHVVFANKAGKAKYLKSPRHDAFVAENREHFANVKVFDSFLVSP